MAGLLLAGAFASATALASSATPAAGNWEGVGSHGLPLSFSLHRHNGRLVATAIAVGAPLTCPARKRDAEAIPLSNVAYSGPGGATGQASGTAVLSGAVPGRSQTARLTGQFSTPTTGTFSLPVHSKVGCGWPTRTLVWQVQRAGRERIRDGVWKASLTGSGITSGSATIRVAAKGRVVRSFKSSYTCESATIAGNGGFTAAPAYEFIRPDGRFYSPLHGNSLNGHRTLWSGRFTDGGKLSGTLLIYDTCAGKIVPLQFQS